MQEGPNAFLRFEITLSEASDDPVTFNIATSDGTAIAGTDYVAKNRSKTIQAGRTAAWFRVNVIDDSHNEDDETFTVTISNVSGATIADGKAIGTIQNSDPMPQGWLARFGRTAAEQRVAVVRDRLGADRSPGFSGRFAGQPLPSPATGAERPDVGSSPDDSPRESGIASLAIPPEGAVLAFRAPAVPELAEDERLAFRSLLADADARVGRRTSGHVLRDGAGVRDRPLHRVLAPCDGASAGRIDARLAALVPYAGREIGEGLSVWGAAGIGSGEMALAPKGADPVTAGIGWSMAAAGAEGTLAPGERLGGADLGWHADALWARTTSDAVRSETGNLAAASRETSRVRLGLRAAWERTLASGITLRQSLEMGLRQDGGDAETGHGLEVGGGIGIGDPARGLTMSVEGRTLALHEDGRSAAGAWA